MANCYLFWSARIKGLTTFKGKDNLSVIYKEKCEPDGQTQQHKSKSSRQTELDLTLVMLNKLRCHAHFKFPANQITWSMFLIEIHILMTNSADPDQLASSEANWSGSTLFAKTVHVLFSKRRVKLSNKPKRRKILEQKNLSRVDQGPVVQNLKKLLANMTLKFLPRNMPNTLMFFAEKMLAIAFTFFQEKNQSIWKYLSYFVCLCWGFTAQSTQWGHVERGQFT